MCACFNILLSLPLPPLSQVSINQPLSFLQRMVEDLVYADSLAQAVVSQGTLEELTHVAAFACSVYAQTSSNARITKPFNPLLGETFECDRRAESGWRCLLEQVIFTVICMMEFWLYIAHKMLQKTTPKP